jgi:hypothetical protein
MLGITKDIQSLTTFRRRLDEAAQEEQTRRCAKRGEGRDIEEFFAEFEATHGISR